jgi:hypothetical protein
LPTLGGVRAALYLSLAQFYFCHRRCDIEYANFLLLIFPHVFFFRCVFGWALFVMMMPSEIVVKYLVHDSSSGIILIYDDLPGSRELCFGERAICCC